MNRIMVALDLDDQTVINLRLAAFSNNITLDEYVTNLINYKMFNKSNIARLSGDEQFKAALQFIFKKKVS